MNQAIECKKLLLMLNYYLIICFKTAVFSVKNTTEGL